MKGNYICGKLTIEIDTNFEKLEGPLDGSGRTHYLVCSACDRVELVAWNVVAYVCQNCQERVEGVLEILAPEDQFQLLLAETYERLKNRTVTSLNGVYDAS